MSEQPSPSQTETNPPPGEHRQGVDLHSIVAEVLLRNGYSEKIADKIVDAITEHDSFRDAAGRVWAQLPVYDAEGNVLPFDVRNVATLEHTAAHILLMCPEAVCVFGGIVYPSSLRTAKIARAVWLGRSGEVVSVPDIFNSLDAIAGLNEAMFVRLQQRKIHEQQQLTMLLSQKRDEYERRAASEATGQAGEAPSQGVGDQASTEGHREPE